MNSRTVILQVVLVCLLGFHSLANGQPQTIDKVIAVVDEGVILQSQFDERMARVQQQIQEQGITQPPAAELRKQIIDQLILESLQLQMAERAGIRIDDNMLNQAMQNIAQQNNLTFDQFRQVLESQGIYGSTRQDLAKEITIGQLQNRAVNQRIDISRQEIENYLRSESGQSRIAPEYNVAHILIPNNQIIPVDRRQELADLVYRQIQDGADIRALASQRQIAGIPVSGGPLGWHKRETLPSIFAPVVPDLSPGEVSAPFASPNGIHLVQLLETRGGTDLSIQQTHLRHILIEPNEIRTDDQARELIEYLHERILAGEDFATIARQNTDDATTMVSGGDLDWISESELPEDFMAVVDSLQVGELSEPFRVESGWHIAEVLGRRQRDVTEENKRFRAQQELRNRKYEME
ncbi:MAG: peptidylprolyl isomerase, partial [Pseudohongiellaceae bacterium]